MKLGLQEFITHVKYERELAFKVNLRLAQTYDSKTETHYFRTLNSAVRFLYNYKIKGKKTKLKYAVLSLCKYDEVYGEISEFMLISRYGKKRGINTARVTSLKGRKNLDDTGNVFNRYWHQMPRFNINDIK